MAAATAAATIVELPCVEINNRRYAPHPNPNAQRTSFEQVIEAEKSTNQAFRLLQLFDRVSKAVSMVLKEMGNALSTFFEGLADKFGTAWQALVFVRLPDVTKKAWEAVANWGAVPEGPAGYVNRDRLQRIHDLADGSAAWLYATSFVFGSMPVKNAADVINLTADASDLSMASEDYALAKKHFEQIDANNALQAPIRQRFQDTMGEAFLRIVKAVASVVGGVLSLMVLVFGGPVLPAAILLAISTISLLAAMAAHFKKEMSPYTKVEFFSNPKSPVVLNGVTYY